MARFVIERHSKRQPAWLLYVLACFPFDRNKSYPDMERYAMMGAVLDYLDHFTYKRRNSMERLGITHNFDVKEYSITVKSINDFPYLTIHLITGE